MRDLSRRTVLMPQTVELVPLILSHCFRGFNWPVQGRVAQIIFPCFKACEQGPSEDNPSLDKIKISMCSIYKGKGGTSFKPCWNKMKDSVSYESLICFSMMKT